MGTAPDQSSGSTSPMSSSSSSACSVGSAAGSAADSGAGAGVDRHGGSSRIGSSSSSLSSESLASDLVALLLSGGEFKKTGAAGFAHSIWSLTLATLTCWFEPGAEVGAAACAVGAVVATGAGLELGPDDRGSRSAGSLTTSVDMVVAFESLHATGGQGKQLEIDCAQ